MGKLLKLKIAPADRANIIDEFGDVSARRAAFAPTEKRYGQLREEIKSWFEGEPAEKDFTEKGQRWQLDVGIMANVTTVKIAAVWKLLGVKKFLAACSVTLKSLSEFLTEPEIESVTTVARTGSRSIAATPIGGGAKGA